MVGRQCTNPWPEMLSYAKELKSKNIQVCLLSNTVRPMSVIARQKGLYKGFNPVILSDEVGRAKPDTAIYQLILDKLQLKATECVYVDDLHKNLEPAAKMGMAVVLAVDGPNSVITGVDLTLSGK